MATVLTSDAAERELTATHDARDWFDIAECTDRSRSVRMYPQAAQGYRRPAVAALEWLPIVDCRSTAFESNP